MCKFRIKQLFDWFNTKVTYPTITNIRETKLNPLSNSDDKEGNTPIEQEICTWGDSGIPHLQLMMNLERITLSISRCVYFAMIGANIIESSQPLNFGPFSRY